MPHETTGILQVYYNNKWGSVCQTATWNQPTVLDIACRMLGFNSRGSPAVQVAIHQLPSGVSNDAWTVNIQHNCPDTVTSLWNCSRTEPCWLTYAVGGSGACSNLIKISCKVNTTFPDLMSCQPPATTIPNPTTSGPDVATEDSLTDKTPTASGHESSSGFSTGGIVAIVVGAIAGVVLLALVASKLCCKRNNRNNRRRGNAAAHNSQRRAQPPPVGETNEQSSDNNPTSGEPAQLQEMRQVGEASDERLSIEVKDGTSGTAANQTSTDPDCSQPTGEPSASEPSGQTDSPKRPGSAMTPIDS
ncbi:uncharacterized protein LOC118410268 [Branchiostoma floridae]|uniref:Uncharacterized protein LOC118410268 n=1 Tax=Branchiostoma floridae TaxID=7739 RepID=A0A9J7KPB5_BRAFL|nr:uncharacterized protein LOC118410268 [Branchiostoma floridae]